MYLIALDEKTGLVKEDATEDSWRGIKTFVKLVDKHGIEGLTVVALSVDYQSILRHYSLEDRKFRASEEIFGDRDSFDFENDEVIKEAYDKYQELQFNTDLEQEQVNNEIKIRLIRRLSEANIKGDDVEIARLNKNLANHEDMIEKFNKRFDRGKVVKENAAANGYILSRIETDIKTRKNSKFVAHGNNIKNPNKLKLEE